MGLPEGSRGSDTALYRRLIDKAFDLIEKDNPKLRGVLTRNYAPPELDQVKLGEIITLFSNLALVTDDQQDMLGRVYEYFLGQFAMAEGRGAASSTRPAP